MCNEESLLLMWISEFEKPPRVFNLHEWRESESERRKETLKCIILMNKTYSKPFQSSDIISAAFFRYQANLISIQFCFSFSPAQLSALITYCISFVLSLSHFLTQYTIRLCTSKLLYGARLCINFVCVPLIDWNSMECVCCMQQQRRRRERQHSNGKCRSENWSKWLKYTEFHVILSSSCYRAFLVLFSPENFPNLILIGVFCASTYIMYMHYILDQHSSASARWRKSSIHVTQPKAGEDEQGGERTKTTR